MINITHLTASTFFGGPERQILGLSDNLSSSCLTRIVLFDESGRNNDFKRMALNKLYPTHVLKYDTPCLLSAVTELAECLIRWNTDILICHGYKASIVGRMSARRIRIPVIAVSRGWTYESLKVRAFELLDRLNLRTMDRVICVSRGQAAKVRFCGVPHNLIRVIPNAIDINRFRVVDPNIRLLIENKFNYPVRWIVGTAGRLSPEKGFTYLIESAIRVCHELPDVGFVVFGEGTLRDSLKNQIERSGLSEKVLLSGFRTNLDQLLPSFDLFVQSSLTEGMPNVLLEAGGAGIPIVATSVGGTPEIITDRESGRLVKARNSNALALTIIEMLTNPEDRKRYQATAKVNVESKFGFQTQAMSYMNVFREVGIKI